MGSDLQITIQGPRFEATPLQGQFLAMILCVFCPVHGEEKVNKITFLSCFIPKSVVYANTSLHFLGVGRQPKSVSEHRLL